MPELRELDIVEIAIQIMDGSTFQEATRPPTIRTGSYVLRFRDFKGQVNEVGQEWIRFSADAEQDGVRKGTQFVSVTPHTYRRDTGKLDKMTVLYAQFLKALGLSPEDSSPAELVAAFQAAPVQAFITEALRAPEEGKYVSAKYTESGDYDADTIALLDSGYVPQNFVQNVSKVKNS